MTILEELDNKNFKINDGAVNEILEIEKENSFYYSHIIEDYKRAEINFEILEDKIINLFIKDRLKNRLGKDKKTKNKSFRFSIFKKRYILYLIGCLKLYIKMIEIFETPKLSIIKEL